MRSSRRLLAVLLASVAAVAAVALATPSPAANRLWVGPSGGLFSTSGNWSPAGMPVPGDSAEFDDLAAVNEVVVFIADRTHDFLFIDNGSYLFQLGGHNYRLTSTTGSSIILGGLNGSDAALSLNSGSLACEDAALATWTPSAAVMWVQAGTSFTVNGQLDVGSGGAGTLHVQGGGQLDTAGAVIGLFGGGDGVVEVQAAGSDWTNAGTLEVARLGQATLTIGADATVATTTLIVARQAGSAGDVVVETGATLDVTGQLDVGLAGDGMLTVSGGATLTNGSQADIAASAGSSGIVRLVDSGTDWISGGVVAVGVAGPGTVQLEGGAAVTCPSLNVLPQGELVGGGRVAGPVLNSGRVAPGLPAGWLSTILADYTQFAGARLEIELGGPGPFDNDLLAVGATATLAGTMDVALIDGYVPAPGTVHTVLTAAPVSGTFDRVDLPPLPLDRAWSIDYDSVGVDLHVNAGPYAYRVSQWDADAGAFVELGFIDPHETSLRFVDYYSYDAPNPVQANFPPGEAPVPVNDESQLFLTHSAADGLAVVMVHDRSVVPLGGVDGGRAEMRLDFFSDPNGAAFLVLDEDTVTGSPGDSSFTWSSAWSDFADGAIVGALDTEGWAAEVRFTNVVGGVGDEFDGLTAWTTYSADGGQIPLALELDRPARIEVVPSCLEDCASPRDGNVDVTDLLRILADWGTTTGCDIDGNGAVDVGDLLAVLALWGSC